MIRTFALFAMMIAVTITAPLQAASQQKLVAYVALDREFSEPILQEFEKKTGITVQPVFDVEASKTVALVNRILAEKERPLCDVFWNNELLQTLRLKQEGALQAYESPSAKDIPAGFRDKDHYWTGFAARARVIIYNKDLIQHSAVPLSIFDWGATGSASATFAIANAHFGTTSTHFAALASIYGKDRMASAIARWKKSNIAVLAGNGPVRNDVTAGRYAFGLTDTDDAFGAIAEKKSVGILFPKEGLLIPNSVALIKNAPHADEGRKLIDFILRKETEQQLAASVSGQIPLRADVPRPAHVPSIEAVNSMPVEWSKMVDQIPIAMDLANRLQQK